MTLEPDSRFTEAIRLFNEGDYYGSHEVLESLWLEVPNEDEYRNLYKGFIQAAAAVYQWRRGILSGARSLLRSSTRYLSPYEKNSLCLDLPPFIEGLNRCLERIENDRTADGAIYTPHHIPRASFVH